MNNLHFVKIEFDEKGADVKINATRGEIVQALSSFISDCVEEDLLPDAFGIIIPKGAKIGSAIATGINHSTLSLSSMKTVYSDLIDVLNIQLTIINKTMKGEN